MNEKPITTECTRCGKPLILRTHAIYVQAPDKTWQPYCVQCNKERLQLIEVLNNAGYHTRSK